MRSLENTRRSWSPIAGAVVFRSAGLSVTVISCGPTSPIVSLSVSTSFTRNTSEKDRPGSGHTSASCDHSRRSASHGPPAGAGRRGAFAYRVRDGRREFAHALHPWRPASHPRLPTTLAKNPMSITAIAAPQPRANLFPHCRCSHVCLECATACAGQCAAVDGPFQCQRPAGHEGDHHAEGQTQDRRWYRATWEGK